MLGIGCMLNQVGSIVNCCCVKLADVKIRPIYSFIQESRLVRSLFDSHSNLIDSTFYFYDYCSIIFFLLFILLILHWHFSSTCGSIDVHIERIPDWCCKISRSGHRWLNNVFRTFNRSCKWGTCHDYRLTHQYVSLRIIWSFWSILRLGFEGSRLIVEGSKSWFNLLVQ